MTPPSRPAAIVLFERLFLLTVGAGIVQAVFGWDDLLTRAPASTILTMLGLTLGTEVTLVLLVSRYRNTAAKWVLLATLIIGVPLYLNSLKRGTVIGLGMLSIIQALLQTASIALLFTGPSREWFRKR